MKIAIASSGLGHVARGIETWALDTATALGELAQPMESEKPVSGIRNGEVCGASDLLPQAGRGSATTLSVTLFCAAPLPSLTSHASPLHISHLKSQVSSFTFNASPLTVRVLSCMKRGDRWVQVFTRIAPGFTWRWGWKSGYDLEQRSFWRLLWPILRDEGYDILHVQDPLLADLCRRYRKAGKLKTKEILAHGTEESVEFLAKFDYVQHLAPWHLEQTLKAIKKRD